MEGNAQLRVWERVLVVLSLSVWIWLFLIGMWVDSTPFREAFRNPFEMGFEDSLTNALFMSITYTASNLMLLALAASLLGALGRRARLGREDDNGWTDKVNPYLSAMIRGFFLYIGILSGLVILAEGTVTTPSQESYARAAGLLSAFAFLINYNPGLFARLVSRVGTALEEGDLSEERAQAAHARHRAAQAARSVADVPAEDREAEAHPQGEGSPR